MPDLLVVSPKECQGLTWQIPEDVEFAATESCIPLHAGELAKAASSMPVALVKKDREWQMVGVCGLRPGHNLFVRKGQWLTNYRPEWLSTYPFKVIQVGKKGLIAFERESGLLDGEVGVPFFDDAGKPSEPLSAMISTLKASHARQQATSRALDALAGAGVVTPWSQALLKQLDQGLEGLHMIDEKALAALDAERFLGLRQAQALPIAYALNLSIPQSHLLNRLSRLSPAQPEPNIPDLLEETDSLRFDF